MQKKQVRQSAVSNQPSSPSGPPQLPLSLLGVGESAHVACVRGKDETRRYLQDLGFVENAPVEVVSTLGGNVIVNIKGTRMAISRMMACSILTYPISKII